MELFQEAVLQLDSRRALYISPPCGTEEVHPRSYCRTCEKYDACTTEKMKDHIIRSFTDVEGTIRSVFVTIAFAMGLDSPDIRHVLHWGPPADLETYVQEVGRSGRNGRPATAILLYQPTDFRGKPGVSDLMKAYCINTSSCRRGLLMEDFYSAGGIEYPSRKCMCCDVCALNCLCQSCQLPNSYVYFKELTHAPACDEFESCVKSKEQSAVKAQLLEYRRQLCERARVPSASLIVGIKIASGIADDTIERVVNNCESVSCKDDLFKFGVTSAEHADVFYDIISQHSL